MVYFIVKQMYIESRFYFYYLLSLAVPAVQRVSNSFQYNTEKKTFKENSLQFKLLTRAIWRK